MLARPPAAEPFFAAAEPFGAPGFFPRPLKRWSADVPDEGAVVVLSLPRLLAAIYLPPFRLPAVFFFPELSFFFSGSFAFFEVLFSNSRASFGSFAHKAQR